MSSKPIYVKARALTARDLTLQPLLKYNDKAQRHVQSSSLHYLWFVDHLLAWDNFEEEAAENFRQMQWGNDIMAYSLPDGDNISVSHILAKDYFLCGEELSISSRYVDHALNPMSAVAKELGYEAVYGDWMATTKHDTHFVVLPKDESPVGGAASTTQEITGEEGSSIKGKETSTKRKRKRLVPDYALIREEDGTPRAVGEAKTPWNHDFVQWWQAFNKTKDDSHSSMRRALGQIGNYMIELELKYGFLTNYSHTFFLKRDVSDGQERLFCSRPIPYNEVPVSENEISIRQGLLFLQTSVEGTDGSPWHAKKVSNNSIIKKSKDEKVKDARARVNTAVRDADEISSFSGAAGLDAGLSNMSIQEKTGVKFSEPLISGRRPNTRSSKLKPGEPEIKRRN